MQISPSSIARLLLLLVVSLACTAEAYALHHVTLRRGGREIQVSGRLLLTAVDGGLLLEARDGTLWAVPPAEQVKLAEDDVPFAPFSREEMSRRLLAELPQGFEIHETAHYLICYDTSKAYAAWCGSLFERLYRAFNTYFGRKGFELKEPEFPLVAIVFADRNTYLKFTRPELGEAGESIIGYFSLRSNRMNMYDLTGLQSFQRYGGRIGSTAQINQILAQPEAIRTVSTIVHEATHQIAFNCGLHQRYSDCPIWFSEGIAVFFETPDLSSSKGWRGVGTVNQPRLIQFRQYLRTRPNDSLRTLIADDKRLQTPATALDAYAEAWALTYFLIRQHPKEYVEYLQTLSKKGPLLNDGPQQRVAEFEKAFGDLQSLDAEFLRYMLRVR